MCSLSLGAVGEDAISSADGLVGMCLVDVVGHAGASSSHVVPQAYRKLVQPCVYRALAFPRPLLDFAQKCARVGIHMGTQRHGITISIAMAVLVCNGWRRLRLPAGACICGTETPSGTCIATEARAFNFLSSRQKCSSFGGRIGITRGSCIVPNQVSCSISRCTFGRATFGFPGA